MFETWTADKVPRRYPLPLSGHRSVASAAYSVFLRSNTHDTSKRIEKDMYRKKQIAGHCLVYGRVVVLLFSGLFLFVFLKPTETKNQMCSVIPAMSHTYTSIQLNSVSVLSLPQFYWILFCVFLY